MPTDAAIYPGRDALPELLEEPSWPRAKPHLLVVGLGLAVLAHLLFYGLFSHYYPFTASIAQRATPLPTLAVQLTQPVESPPVDRTPLDSPLESKTPANANSDVVEAPKPPAPKPPTATKPRELPTSQPKQPIESPTTTPSKRPPRPDFSTETFPAINNSGSTVFDNHLRNQLGQPRPTLAPPPAEEASVTPLGTDQSLYVQGDKCYRIKHSQDDKDDALWEMGKRCAWVKSESETMVDAMTEALKERGL